MKESCSRAGTHNQVHIRAAIQTPDLGPGDTSRLLRSPARAVVVWRVLVAGEGYAWGSPPLLA
jgi:hypothetical protein